MLGGISALISCVRNAVLCIHRRTAHARQNQRRPAPELEDDIEHGRLSPGDRLDEQTLATRFEVSRTPAREALLQLAAAGIVRMVPRQGAVVSSVSPQLAIGMVEVLTALEAEAAGLAARRMSDAEKAQLGKVHAGVAGRR